MVSVQPQDSSIKDDDEIPYSSSDEEPIPVMSLVARSFSLSMFLETKLKSLIAGYTIQLFLRHN